MKRIREAIELCVEVKELKIKPNHFIGMQRIAVSI